MHRSYVSATWIDNFIKDHHHELPAHVVKRFVNILRIKPKEKVAVFDGEGREISGLLIHDKHKAYFHDGHLSSENPPKYKVILLQAALVETKLSETIKRGCEIGVDIVIIYNAHFSDAYCYQKAYARKERLYDIAIDASRQSGRLWVPKIHYEESLAKALSSWSENTLGIYGDISSGILLSSILLTWSNNTAKSLAIMVGPEGGFHHQEIALLKSYNCIGVRWAPYTLRSELAGLFAISIINTLRGKA